MVKTDTCARMGIMIFFSVSLILTSSLASSVQKSTSSITDEQAILRRINSPFKGDLGEIRKRRIIRVLVSYCKTNYFFDHGKPRGFEYELLKAYEKFLNQNVKNAYAKTKMIFVPIPFDQILRALNKGQGDIAAATLTITPERQKIVNFTKPYISRVDEIVVLNKNINKLQSLEDLSNQKVYVRKGSSYVAHLASLNQRLKKLKKRPIKILESQEYLVTEDILEMVNAGIVDITVADHHEARAWSQVLPNIVIRNDLKINSEGRIAWAVRKENQALLSSLNDFIQKSKKGTLLGNILFKRYYQDSKWIKNPIAEAERKKLAEVMDLFKKYAARYHFNFLELSAQAYQESGLDNSKRSPTGAIGIMQVLPETASDKNINIKNIYLLENNIHAGAKYLNFLRTRYFSIPGMKPADRVFFSWAAYNAGPGRIYNLRKETIKRGFNPNKWFFNVEKIASELIGRETVDYVANINKYYVAYQLYFEIHNKRTKIKQLLHD
ncbi:MAG: transporter substrate-binding domain-containing protein [Desulfobacterales bacterium]